jgi:hypothetical protein
VAEVWDWLPENGMMEYVKEARVSERERERVEE